MHHNLKIKDDDFSIQSNQEHVARAFADADKARMDYLNKRIAETADDTEEGEVNVQERRTRKHVTTSVGGQCTVCGRWRGVCIGPKRALTPHVKTAPGTPCLICGQKLGHCSGIRRTMVNGRLQNVQE